MLYGNTGDQLVTESAPLDPAQPPVLQSAADMEGLVRASALDWMILRGGRFYGPGTGADEGWRADARTGRLAIPGDGTGYIPLIHVADMARAVVLAVEMAPPASIYNVVDDEPVQLGQLYRYVAAQTSVPDPPSGADSPLPASRCSSAKIKAELGWQPAYPTYRSGLAT